MQHIPIQQCSDNSQLYAPELTDLALCRRYYRAFIKEVQKPSSKYSVLPINTESQNHRITEW